jgi:hypothetical protein
VEGMIRKFFWVVEMAEEWRRERMNWVMERG